MRVMKCSIRPPAPGDTPEHRRRSHEMASSVEGAAGEAKLVYVATTLGARRPTRYLFVVPLKD